MLVSPKKRIYIGQSIDIDRRLFEHKHDKRNSSRKLKNSLEKYGFEKHKVVILTECEKEDLNKWERFFQDAYGAMGRNGLNSMLTGYNDVHTQHTEETKAKLSEIFKGRPMPKVSPEVKQERIEKMLETRRINGTLGKNDKTLERERIRELAIQLAEEQASVIELSEAEIEPVEKPKKANTRTPEHIRKIVESRKKNGSYGWKPESLAKMIATRTGQKATDEAKANISKGLKGLKRTPEQVKAMSERMKGNTPWNKGVPRTEEDKIKMVAGRIGKYLGENSKRSKLILNMETGIYYYGSVDAASSITHLKPAYINEMVAGLKKNKTAFERV